MGDKLLEQRINIMFLVKLKKNVTNIYTLLQQVYGEGQLIKKHVLVWVKLFQDIR
jgi:hypothetical protein